MNDALTQIAAIVGAISFVTFIALFGHVPRLRNTPIGWIHRFALNIIPRWMYKLDLLVTGGCCFSCLSRCGNHLMNDKHPLVMIFYLALVTGGLGMFLHSGWRRISLTHKLLVPIVSAFPYITLFKAAASNPGIITPENHYNAMRVYPYDNINFHPGIVCRTCLLYKPARSKHCSVCKCCIAKHDHHCIWINNCVGHNNTRHFFAFLWATNILLTYGGYLSYSIMNNFIQSLLRRGTKVSDLPWGLYFKGWGIGFLQETPIAAVFLLSVMCGILSYSFTFYHVYLVWAGTTTNETFKWSDWSEDISTGEIYIADLLPFTPVSSTTHPSSLHNIPHPSLPNTNPALNPPSSNCYPTTAAPLTPSEIQALIEPPDVKWRQAEGLKEVENLYDLGFVENMRMVIWPKPL
ncbi:DHHC palmitoyltransferase-domain-containing protein [Kalaharituber pfeilii]|nr:DHHC palmitoyltransferase-domain-containing protein [Kalaharituber pfeilii]